MVFLACGVGLARVGFGRFVSERSSLGELHGTLLEAAPRFLIVCNEEHVNGSALVGRVVRSGSMCFLDSRAGRTGRQTLFTGTVTCDVPQFSGIICPS